jgi:hypothetical protein
LTADALSFNWQIGEHEHEKKTLSRPPADTKMLSLKEEWCEPSSRPCEACSGVSASLCATKGQGDTLDGQDTQLVVVQSMSSAKHLPLESKITVSKKFLSYDTIRHVLCDAVA